MRPWTVRPRSVTGASAVDVVDPLDVGTTDDDGPIGTGGLVTVVATPVGAGAVVTVVVVVVAATDVPLVVDVDVADDEPHPASTHTAAATRCRRIMPRAARSRRAARAVHHAR